MIESPILERGAPGAEERDARRVRVLAARPRVEQTGNSVRSLKRVLTKFLHAGASHSGVSVRHRRLYLIETAASDPTIGAADHLCADFGASEVLPQDVSDHAATWIIDVLFRPGVTDAEGESLTEVLIRGGHTGARARTGHRYALHANVDEAWLPELARAVANPVVSLVCWRRPDQPAPTGFWESAFQCSQATDPTVQSVTVRELDDESLLTLSRERLLSLPLQDLRAVADHFSGIGRDPTDAELETIAQTWSEHCAHRTFRATIQHREPGSPPRVIRGLLRETIMAATRRVNRPWVLSAFVDNAGVIAFDRQYAIACKVETHNHPSAIEPFGGAATGVGGVVRDVLGVSAEPIANTDVLCFGPLDVAPESVPEGALHPATVYSGVVAGIADYGNKIGIPTVNGAVVFDEGYVGNPLVFCGTVGLLPRGEHPTQPAVGDLIVVAGGRTGRDGVHGATFSSDVIQAEATSELGSVVQIGDPIVEKRLADALTQARDQRLYSAITDCGAGGLSSAVGEMARELGARVNLALVPLKYPGLKPWEIWLSEAQERMVLAVPPSHWPTLSALCRAEQVEATVIGSFTGTGRLEAVYGDRSVVDLATHFLFEEMPSRNLASQWQPPAARAEEPPRGDLGSLLLRALAHPNVASKEIVVRQYDHEVQGRTVGKPFVGPLDAGPADAAVLQPIPTSRQGLAIGCGINPRIGVLDPHAMAMLAVDEALRNVVAVGADPDRVAVLDNFCWGNPSLPDRLGGLVRASQGCHDAAVGFRVPFISGKDSLNNELRLPSGETRAIPGTLLITAIGTVPDVNRVVSMPLKRDGNRLYAVGTTDAALGGSLILQLDGSLGRTPPAVKPRVGRALLRRMHRALKQGLARACHDLSEGGLAVAVAEMALASDLGIEIDLRLLPRASHVSSDHVALFAESATRFLVEVEPADAGLFESTLRYSAHAAIGTVLPTPLLRITGLDGSPVLEIEVDVLRRAWRGGLESIAP
ncbi:MAG: phosphoribosylformylglycinamidine synthase subunit PurL [Chloroflexota bacterium]